MEKRDRDKVSQSNQPTDAGNVNRDDASHGQEDSSADFGKKIGESEFREPGSRKPEAGESSDNESTVRMKISNFSRKTEMNH